MSKKRGLGKGLGSIIGESNMLQVAIKNRQSVSINQLVANPYQPRKQFDESAISTLADSIGRHGIIQPLAVRPVKGNDELYEIIAGERRFRAAKEAGLTEVPVVIHDVSDADSAVFALIENLQREDLNVIEKAIGIRRLIDEFSLTHEACGKLLAQSRSGISNTLRLLDLDELVQQAVMNKEIDMGHARALLPVENATQPHLLQQVRLNGLSVRETESLVKKHLNDDTGTKKKNTKNQEIKLIENELSKNLGTKVRVSQQANGTGKITLDFVDNLMLEKLHKKLSNENH